jgi:hypothetical protein
VHAARTASDQDHFNTLALDLIRIRLFDTMHNPMGGAPYRLTAGDRQWPEKGEPPGTANGDAWIEIHCQGVPEECQLEWGEGDAPGAFLYTQSLHLSFPHDDEEEALKRRLHNLGYSAGNALTDNTIAFQTDYQMDTSADIRRMLEEWHDAPENVKPKPESAPPPSPGADP